MYVCLRENDGIHVRVRLCMRVCFKCNRNCAAWMTLQQQDLDISTLAPVQSTPKDAQPTGETNTHFIFGVDVGFGFDQCDDNIGTPMTMTKLSSQYQWSDIILRTQ